MCWENVGIGGDFGYGKIFGRGGCRGGEVVNLGQSPQNVGILGSRIPRKGLESEEGLRLKG